MLRAFALLFAAAFLAVSPCLDFCRATAASTASPSYAEGLPESGALDRLVGPGFDASQLNKLFDGQGLTQMPVAAYQGNPAAMFPRRSENQAQRRAAARRPASPLVAAWIADMRALPSAREHLKFLEENKLRIVFDDPSRAGSKIGGGIAYHENGEIHVNKVYLNKIRSELRRQGAPEEEIPALMAHKTVQWIAHEARHAMTAGEIEKAAGMRFRATLLESEVLSFIDQTRVQAEAAQRWPEASRYKVAWLDQDNANLAEAWQMGLEQVERCVLFLYGVPSALALTDESFAAYFKDWVDETRDFSWVSDNLIDQAPPAAVEERLAKAAEVEKFISGPARVKILRDYYRQRYEEVRATFRAGR